jgi:hypothetical protein
MIANNLEARICLQVPNTDRFVIASARKERAAARKREAIDWAGVSFELGCKTILLNGCQQVIGASGHHLPPLQGCCTKNPGYPCYILSQRRLPLSYS